MGNRKKIVAKSGKPNVLGTTPNNLAIAQNFQLSNGPWFNLQH
jgi:hypothetical protein